MTEKEYKAFEQWSRDMRDATIRGLEIAQERCSAQLTALNTFEKFIEAMRKATMQEEKAEARNEYIRTSGSADT